MKATARVKAESSGRTMPLRGSAVPHSNASVEEWALFAFKTLEAADQFLDLPNPALGNRIPRAMAQTEKGAQEVVAVLSRFMHGDYA